MVFFGTDGVRDQAEQMKIQPPLWKLLRWSREPADLDSG
jgi:hypothetical protein